MTRYLECFWQEEDGQDLVEYSLLIAFLALCCMGLFGAWKPAAAQIWQVNNDHMANALSAARGS